MDSNKLVWFPDSTHGYCIGKIVDIAQANVSIAPVALPSRASLNHELVDDSSGATNVLEFPYKSIYPCDQLDLSRLRTQRPEDVVDADDNCALIHLNEAALLENVRVRFYRDKIYTYVAHILIAVNPYFEIKSLHSPEVIVKYQGKSLGALPPHVYAIGESPLGGSIHVNSKRSLDKQQQN